MSIKALSAAKAKLSADAALNAYWLARYNKPARHVIGYKRTTNANDYPFICYAPVSSSRADMIGGRNKEQVAIVVGVNESELTNDVFDGVQVLSDVEALIFACLEQGDLGAGTLYLGDARVINDLAVRHPFHEMEITMLLAAR